AARRFSGVLIPDRVSPSVLPEAIEALGVHLCIARRIGDLPVPEVRSEGAGIDAIVDQLEGVQADSDYGIDGVYAWPALPNPLPREIFILGECIAPTAERASAVVRTTKQ